MFREESQILYLSYFDDSGSEPSSPVCVFGGVIIPGDSFGNAEAWSRIAVEHLGMTDDATEFKAHDLYYGGGKFRGIDKTKCRTAFLLLLNFLNVYKYPFLYSAVDTRKLSAEPLFGSSSPVDTAFEMCLGQLEQWAREQFTSPLTDAKKPTIDIRYENMCVVIADECDPSLRKQLLKTFRRKRTRYPLLNVAGADISKRLFHVHDSMYFGDSQDSVGLQIADAANWAMHRFFTNQQLDDNILEQLKAVSICAMPEPEWTSKRHLFKRHTDVRP